MFYPLPREEHDLDDIREIVASFTEYTARANESLHLDYWLNREMKGSFREWLEREITDRVRQVWWRGTDTNWKKTRKTVWERDGGQCHVCGRFIDWSEYECGHIIDRVAGGSDRPANLVVMCVVCNQTKPVHETRAEYIAWVETEPWRLGERRGWFGLMG